MANYGVVEEGVLYRSALPEDAGYSWLLNRGFKSTVSLVGESSDTTAKLLGLGFRNHLWLDITDETSPTDEQGVRFLQFAADPQNWPILVHCKVGLGRTATMVALARYTFDGWSMERALDEARVYRGGTDLNPKQVVWLKQWAASHPQDLQSPITTRAQN